MNDVKALFHRGWKNALNPWFDIYFILMQRRIIMMFTIIRTITVMANNNGEDDDDDDDGSLKASLIWHLFRSAALNHHALTDMSCARWLISHHFVYLRVYLSLCSCSISWGYLTFSLKTWYFIFCPWLQLTALNMSCIDWLSPVCEKILHLEEKWSWFGSWVL